jgi:hypothetical protein
MPAHLNCGPTFCLVAAVAFIATTLSAANPELKEAEAQKPLGRLPTEIRLYEWRVLRAAPGKLDSLHSRLRDHQIPLLEQHGVFTQGVFVPAGENPEQRVYLLVAAEGLGAMQDGWRSFREDPKWLEAVAKSEEADAGKVVLQDDYQRLVKTYWSPQFTPTKSAEPRVFELRTYTCPDHETQTALQRRFREHTMELFEKHGMQNIVYWTLDSDEPGFRQKLVYLLAHKSQDAAKEGFTAFRKDPDWMAAKEASEKAAGGSLTAKKKGVVSQFLEATQYSPLK